MTRVLWLWMAAAAPFAARRCRPHPAQRQDRHGRCEFLRPPGRGGEGGQHHCRRERSRRPGRARPPDARHRPARPHRAARPVRQPRARARSRTERISRPLPPLDSIPAVQSYLREQARQTPKGEWIVVPRTFPTRLSEMQMPTREDLDVITRSSGDVRRQLRRGSRIRWR